MAFSAWYSTGSYFFAKEFVEMLPSLVYGICYSSIIYYLSGQLLETERFFGYIAFITIGFLIADALGHSIGIIMLNHPELSIMTSIGIISLMANMGNYFIATKDLPLPFQFVSEFCFPKHIFNSVLILVYGLNRCSTDEKSVVLLKYNVKDKDLGTNIDKLVLYLFVTRLFSFIILYMKTETRISLKLFRKQKSKTNESVEIKSKKKKREYFNRKMSMAVTKINMSNSKDSDSETDLNNNEMQKRLISIAWTDLTLCVPKTLFKHQKVILKQINGFFEFGTINALMGPSGAGKTTLLNCINGLHQEYVTYESNILLSKFKTIRSCFITQNQKDHILNGLTSRQSLIYASKLKNSDKNFDHNMNVGNIMNELMISNTSETYVESCSGGEQKRLVIAMELTSSQKPHLLCIDEPTSGLDSNASEVVSI